LKIGINSSFIITQFDELIKPKFYLDKIHNNYNAYVGCDQHTLKCEINSESEFDLSEKVFDLINNLNDSFKDIDCELTNKKYYEVDGLDEFDDKFQNAYDFERKFKKYSFIVTNGFLKVTDDLFLKKENIKIDKATFLEKIKDSKIKPSKEKDLIEINGVFVDCILLVKYIDWVLSEPALNEIEEGGVINPNLLLDFEKVKTEVPIEKLDSNNNTKDTIGNPALNQGTGKFFEYQIIRLSIPASPADSTMTFRISNGSIETIATADYGFIGTYCIEENSFSGNSTLYQKTQLAPCNISGNVNNGGGYRGGGSYDYYDNQNRNIDYIDKQRDFQNIR